MKVTSLLRARAEVGELDEFRQVRYQDCDEGFAVACRIKDEAGSQSQVAKGPEAST